jgi:hypothetical protein
MRARVFRRGMGRVSPSRSRRGTPSRLKRRDDTSHFTVILVKFGLFCKFIPLGTVCGTLFVSFRERGVSKLDEVVKNDLTIRRK